MKMCGRATNYPSMDRQEREFAVQHHELVFRFLAMNHLPAFDWYDVVIFRYMRSVSRWFAELELHYYSFSTIAFQAMRSAVETERQKQRRRIQFISLDDIISGTDDLTWGDMITTDNLDYIPYVEVTECRFHTM